MIGTNWHVDTNDLADYAAGRSAPVRLASIEAHLGRCETCRAAVGTHVRTSSPAGAALLWDGIADRIDAGPRTLRRSPRLTMVSLSSPPLALATSLLAGALVVLVLLARLGSARFATTTLVSLGPIAPLAGAHLAFGRRVDPAGRMADALPMAVGRVAASRALMSTVLACVAGLVVTPLTNISLGSIVVWLLPALAVSATTVAIGTFVDATLPSAALALAWLAVVGVWWSGAPQALRGASTDGLWSELPAVQIALLAATVAAAVVTVARRDVVPAWRSAS